MRISALLKVYSGELIKNTSKHYPQLVNKLALDRNKTITLTNIDKI
jgi:hypothetical protein